MDRRVTQLPETEDKRQQIVLVEEPFFFHHPKKRAFKIHRLKLVFHRACLRYYQDFLIQKGFQNVAYISYDDMLKAGDIVKALKLKAAKTIPKNKSWELKFVDPHDTDVSDDYFRACDEEGIDCVILDDDIGFIMGRKDLDAFHDEHKGKKRIQHSSFFDKVKEKEGVLVDTASTDTKNRKSLPSGFREVFRASKMTKSNNEYLQEAINYINQHDQFKTHYGSLDIVESNKSKDGSPSVVPQDNKNENDDSNGNEFVTIPVTHEDAQRHLSQFIRTRFGNFGDYQDAVHSNYAVLYHSHCSFLLNAGLLTPREVMQKVLEKKGKIPMNALEGFLRQLLGWREYMRYIYTYYEDELKKDNVFQLDRKIVTKKQWYEGTLGIFPIDNEIRKINRLGHAHHIIRLMFLLNFMVLCNVRKEDVVQWFMEMVALDAYPWVMWSNIGAMGFYSEKFMRKPYISTSNYICKMSNYNDDGTNDGWTDIWDALFYHFISSKERLMKQHASIYTRNLAHYNKKSPGEKKKLNEKAATFINAVSQA